MKITLSKSQWEFIGNVTGWIKTSGQPPVRLPLSELAKRFREIGWTVRGAQDNAHTLFFDPANRCSPVDVGNHNYETGHHLWKSVMGQFLRCNRDLRFVFQTPFKIPPNFDIKTQRIEAQVQEPTEKILKVPFVNAPLHKWLVLFQGEWKKPFDVDYSQSSIMFEDGSIMTVPNNKELVTVKEPN